MAGETLYRAFLMPQHVEDNLIDEKDDSVSSDDGIDSLISQLESFKAPNDPIRRAKLRHAAQEFADRMYEPQERINHIVYSAMTLPFCRIANDIGVLDLLSQCTGPVTVQDISRASGAEYALLGARYLASIGVITEVSPHGYKANDLTRSLCGPNVKPAIWFAAECHLKPVSSIPSAVSAAKFRTPTRTEDVAGPIALRHAIAAPYGDFKDHPMYSECFKAWMAGPLHTRGTFLNVIDLESLFRANIESPPSFVDIGGNNGDTCRLVSEYHPSFNGRVFLQDVDSNVVEAYAGPGVTKLENDFWSDQPTHEPRLYYFQSVMARISDTFLMVFLKTVADAMGDESLILVDEFVLPEHDATRRLAEIDMILMVLYRDRYGTGRLRTQSEWQRVIKSAGLELVSARRYDEARCRIIMVIRKPAHTG